MANAVGMAEALTGVFGAASAGLAGAGKGEPTTGASIRPSSHYAVRAAASSSACDGSEAAASAQASATAVPRAATAAPRATTATATAAASAAPSDQRAPSDTGPHGVNAREEYRQKLRGQVETARAKQKNPDKGYLSDANVRAQLAEAFEVADADLGGELDQRELLAAVTLLARQFGAVPPPPSMVSKVFRLVDADGDGMIAPWEFFDSDGLRLVLEQSLSSYVSGASASASADSLEMGRVAYREALRSDAAPLLESDARLRASEQRLLDIFECADIDLSGELDSGEFGLALRLVQRAWPTDSDGGAREVSGSGLGADVGQMDAEAAEEAMRFAQMDADGGGSVSFAELVRLRQRQLTHYSLLTTLHYLLLLLTTHDSQLTAY